ncbi:MAG: hypothetical protein F6K62_01460 [Sphaerospermopsis sp. SIO1G2]|nr:hypothetical protein [Sphaerospermopsis sp. SIO1G2]
MSKKDQDSENKGQKSFLNQMKKKFQELKERSLEVRIYLSKLNLDQLSALTQDVGMLVNKVYCSISMIVAELIRRAKKNQDTFNITLKLDDKIETVSVDSSTSETDEKKVTELIRTWVENGSSVEISVQHSPLKNNNSDLYIDVNNFQQELERLKGKEKDV